MNTPNLLPPSSPVSQPAKRRSTVGLTVATIAVLHAVFFAGLLFQGCKQKNDTAGGVTNNLASDLTAPTNAAYPDLTRPSPSLGATQQVAEAPPLAATNLPLATPAPTPTPAAPPAPPPSAAGPTEYTVVAGDFPARIAAKHGVPLRELMKANPGLDPRKLKVNQKLVIPAPVAPAASGAPAVPGGAPGATAEPGSLHVVKRGENLTKIAKQHGVSPKAIRSANNLKTDRIQVGQKLKIPAGKGAAAASTTAPGMVAAQSQGQP